MGIDTFSATNGINKYTATLDANGISNAINVQGEWPACIYVPKGMVGTSLTFKASCDDGSSFSEVRDDTNTAITVTISATAACIGLRRLFPFAVGQLQIISGGTTSDAGKVLTLTTQKPA